MSYIISRNYLEKDGSFTWLVREEGQKPSKRRRGLHAGVVRSLHAKNVVFKEGSEVEKKYGCNIVGVAESVETNIDIIWKHPEGQALTLDNDNGEAKIKVSDEKICFVESLVLSADGKATNTTAGVAPDNGNEDEGDSKVTEDKHHGFRMGDKLVLDKDARPCGMVGKHVWYADFQGVDGEGDVIVRYNDGTRRGDYTYREPKQLRRAK